MSLTALRDVSDLLSVSRVFSQAFQVAAREPGFSPLGSASPTALPGGQGAARSRCLVTGFLGFSIESGYTQLFCVDSRASLTAKKLDPVQ